MTSEPPWHRTHLAVPRADEALLAVPDLNAAVAAAKINAAGLDDCEIDLQGRPLSRLRREANGEAIRLARVFTSDVLGDAVANAVVGEPLIVPGHQPALYHPGVWAKNFASAGIARRLGGSVLNLIVDNDIYSRPAIDVPAGTRAEPRREAVPFDVLQPPRPWERAKVKDAETFRAFASRVSQKLRHFGVEPIVDAAWPAATSRLALCGTLPECLTAARHSIEADWGLHNLELPMSRLCETDSFLWFAGHLLAQLPRFNEVYNGTLSEYRRLYRIKSRNHPVPSLEERGDWLEAPFWVWRDDAPHRRRVFARQSGKETMLADDTGDVFATLPLASTMDACCAVEVLRTLPSQKIRFRTRALTTTLFARLFLADTFMHGIGGAKYDEMTDRIIARFIGIPAPSYATVSASLYLPFAEPFDATSEDERRLLGLLRDLDQNPQRHLSHGIDPVLDRRLDEKEALIAAQDAAWAERGLSKSERRRRSAENGVRFERLQRITQDLATFTAEQRRHALAELESVRRARKANRVLTSREFTFALYPEAKLRPFLTGLM
ncbi:MAG: hypothetical protein M3552_09860 [Planctomycetota bacterium]|nr:hypothetical protein [Planctomycetaceae bacterium]MDQ3330943.1 hypothetical protein [Planctomycetota bacterium]